MQRRIKKFDFHKKKVNNFIIAPSGTCIISHKSVDILQICFVHSIWYVRHLLFSKLIDDTDLLIEINKNR